jgi:hypothetical protein
MSKVLKLKNVGKRMKVVGSYLGLTFLVFATVGLLAFFENTGNFAYVIAGLAVLALFLWLCLQVHYRHRGTMYGLEDLR